MHDGFLASQSWPYALHYPVNSTYVVPIPLVHSSRTRIQHEAYASALAFFPRLIGADQIAVRIVDGAVAHIEQTDYERLKHHCLDKIPTCKDTATRLAEEALRQRTELPRECLAAERAFIQESLGSEALLRLHALVARAIAVNFANPFVVFAFALSQEMFAGTPKFEALLSELFRPPTFSHITFFSKQLARLRESGEPSDIAIQRFCWSAGFLGDGAADGSPYESPGFVRSVLTSEACDGPSPCTLPPLDEITMPDFGLDPSNLTDRWCAPDNQLVRLLHLLRHLQVHEEFRHYWQARSIRLFRLAAGGPEAAESTSLQSLSERLS